MYQEVLGSNFNSSINFDLGTTTVFQHSLPICNAQLKNIGIRYSFVARFKGIMYVKYIEQKHPMYYFRFKYNLHLDLFKYYNQQTMEYPHISPLHEFGVWQLLNK